MKLIAKDLSSLVFVALAGLSPALSAEALSDEELGAVVAQGGYEGVSVEEWVSGQQLEVASYTASSMLAVLRDTVGSASAVTSSAAIGSDIRFMLELGKLANPLALLLDYEVSVEGIVYTAEAKDRVKFESDGSVTMRFPDRIESLSFDNIRVQGADTSQAFFSMDMMNVRMKDSLLTVSYIR